MANVRAQVPNKAKDAQVGAAAANSVPALRSQVVTLAQDVERLSALVAKLTIPREKP